jgi:uncharacterized membrane protein
MPAGSRQPEVTLLAKLFFLLSPQTELQPSLLAKREREREQTENVDDKTNNVREDLGMLKIKEDGRTILLFLVAVFDVVVVVVVIVVVVVVAAAVVVVVVVVVAVVNAAAAACCR